MDPVQLIASFIAIVLLAGVAYKLFPEKDVLTLASAKEDYLRFNANAVIGTPILGKDHHTAILPLNAPGDQLGIVTKLGDQLVCRTLQKGDVTSLSANKDVLTIVCNDFTQPTIRICLGADDMARAETLITGFTKAAGDQNAA